MVVVPFAGRVPAAGRLPDELEDEIADRLRIRLALAEGPDVAIEIAAWPPVIVTGDVRAPGSYEFMPGMVAIQAAGLAGGTGAPFEDDSSVRRDAVAQQTALVVLQSEERRLIARQARLMAELENREAVPLEPSPVQDPAWAAIVRSEEHILQIRRDRLARELSAIDSEAELYTAEIEALEQKTEALNRQRDLANEAAANADDLAERGLVGNQRVLDTARTLADIEGQLLDVSTAILAARQNLASAERERISLIDARTAEVVESLQEVDAQLAETRERIAGQFGLLRELGTGLAAVAAPEPEISVLRPEDGQLRRIADASMTLLQPGDIVEVVQPLPSGSALAYEAADRASVIAEPDPWPEPAISQPIPAPPDPEPLPARAFPALSDPEPLSETAAQAGLSQVPELPAESDGNTQVMDKPMVSPVSRPD
jgi:exopolysaccharide production protein ExoF